MRLQETSGGRGAFGDVALLEQLGLLGLLDVEAGDKPVVLDSDDELASSGVREGADVPSEVLGVDPRALAVEVMVLLHGGEDLYVVCGHGALHGATSVRVSRGD